MTSTDERNWLDSLEACVRIAEYFSGRDVDPRIGRRYATIVRDRLTGVLHWLDSLPDQAGMRATVMTTIERHGLRRYLAAGDAADGR